MDLHEELRDQVKAGRAAKKAFKAAAKLKGKINKKAEMESTLLDTLDEPKLHEMNLNVNLNIERSLSSPLIPSIQPEVIYEENRDMNKQNSKYKNNSIKKNFQEKSQSELKSGRRNKQEFIRSTKDTLINAKLKQEENEFKKVQDIYSTVANKKALIHKGFKKVDRKDNPHEVKLFKHLYINEKNISQLLKYNNGNIHPAILKLGVQYAEKVIVGSNARCVALFAAVREFIRDFVRPSQADFTRGLEMSLQECINYLNSCRLSAVSMQNALKHLKWQMSILHPTISDKEAKSKLLNAIDIYIQEQILLADKAISHAIQMKILNGDVILTYGFSSLINKILCDAFTAGKLFRVVIIDGRPWFEGKELLRQLMKHGINCSYILMNALTYIMPQVSKVFLGAHAILANGAVMSRVGTAQVALIANAFNVPVLVACETHKSCERVQTDSIVFNEIADPEEIVKNLFDRTRTSCLSNWKTRKFLNLLNIIYDVTPANLVTAVVTELAILPCTSVPVILRIKPSEI